MGRYFSRTLLALPFLLVLSASAADEDVFKDAPGFYVELTGPDGKSVESETAIGGQKYGPISSDDTLWSIATRFRPNTRVSVYQTMSALFRKNPHAFANNNINQLINGSILTIPSYEEIANINESVAQKKLADDKRIAQKVAQKPEAKPVLKAQVKPTPAPVSVAKPEAPAVDVAVLEQAKLEFEEKFESLRGEQAKELGELKTQVNESSTQLTQVAESNHRMKLKLQGLTDDISLLKEQLVKDAKIQMEIKALLTQQLQPKAEEMPVEQAGIMESITSSWVNLAAIIAIPALLVLLIVSFWLKARSKKELEEQEQELAESTTNMMDQDDGKYDQLLSEDVVSEEIDLDVPDEEPAGKAEELNAEGLTNANLAGEDLDLLEEIDLGQEEEIDQGQEEEQIFTDEDETFSNGAEEAVAEAPSDEELLAEFSIEEQEAAPAELDEQAPDADKLTEAVDLEVAEPEGLAAEDLAAAKWAEQLAETPAPESPDDLDLSGGDLDITSEAPVDDQPAEEMSALDELSLETEGEIELGDLEAEPDTAPDLEELAQALPESAPADDFSLDQGDPVTPAEPEAESPSDQDPLEFNVADLEGVDDTDFSALEQEALASEPQAESEDDSGQEWDFAEIESVDEIEAEDSSLDSSDALAAQLGEVAFDESVEPPEVPHRDHAEEDRFIDIEKLLDESESSETTDEPYDEVTLDVGLDEFPDIMPENTDVDVDQDEGGIGAKLDLARAYLEIDDKAGAKELLEEIKDLGTEEQKGEVAKLLGRMS